MTTRLGNAIVATERRAISVTINNAIINSPDSTAITAAVGVAYSIRESRA